MKFFSSEFLVLSVGIIEIYSWWFGLHSNPCKHSTALQVAIMAFYLVLRWIFSEQKWEKQYVEKIAILGEKWIRGYTFLTVFLNQIIALKFLEFCRNTSEISEIFPNSDYFSTFSYKCLPSTY